MYGLVLIVSNGHFNFMVVIIESSKSLKGHLQPKMAKGNKCVPIVILKECLHISIFLSCLLFTLYQTYMCFVKYQSIPKGTNLKVTESNLIGNNFPAITFCSRVGNGMEETTGFNKGLLNECNINNG